MTSLDLRVGFQDGRHLELKPRYDGTVIQLIGLTQKKMGSDRE